MKSFQLLFFLNMEPDNISKQRLVRVSQANVSVASVLANHNWARWRPHPYHLIYKICQTFWTFGVGPKTFIGQFIIWIKKIYIFRII